MRTLNGHALINNHELDVTTSALEAVMDWFRLILADIIKYPQSGSLFVCMERLV